MYTAKITLMSDYGYFCEGGGGWGEFGSFRMERESEPTEESPEVEITKEEVELFENIMRLWAQLIEKGGEKDTGTRASMRAQIVQGLAQLGVTADEDGLVDIESLKKLVVRIDTSKEKPKRKSGFPSFENFADELKEIKGIEIKGKDGIDLAEYLYTLGVIMNSEVAYEHIFKADPMGEADEARHRKLALLVLKKCGYKMDHNWLK